MILSKATHRGQENPNGRKSKMLVLGHYGSLQMKMIPLLFGIAEDRDIGQVEIIPYPETADLRASGQYSLCVITFEVYSRHRSYFNRLPDPARERVVVLTKPENFDFVEPEMKTSCYCPELKAVISREVANIVNRCPAAAPEGRKEARGITKAGILYPFPAREDVPAQTEQHLFREGGGFGDGKGVREQH